MIMFVKQCCIYTVVCTAEQAHRTLQFFHGINPNLRSLSLKKKKKTNRTRVSSSTRLLFLDQLLPYLLLHHAATDEQHLLSTQSIALCCSVFVDRVFRFFITCRFRHVSDLLTCRFQSVPHRLRSRALSSAAITNQFPNVISVLLIPVLCSVISTPVPTLRTKKKKKKKYCTVLFTSLHLHSYFVIDHIQTLFKTVAGV